MTARGAGEQGADQEARAIDSDIEVDRWSRHAGRPPHLRWRYLGLVFVGGMLGVALREGATLWLGVSTSVPWDILGINVLGAFVLGAFLEALARSGPDEGRRRVLRLTVGTGMIGGFTTYSALSVDAAELLIGGHPVAGVAYALGSVAAGLLASWLGITVAAGLQQRLHRRVARA